MDEGRLALVSQLVRSWWLSDRRLRERLRSPPSTQRLTASDAAALRTLSDQERSKAALCISLLPAFAVGWAVNELIAGLGMVAWLLNGRAWDAAPFLFVAALLFLLSFPRLEPFLQRVSSLDAG